jgi:hypothetical protein
VNIPQEKRCLKCLETKSLDEFGKDKYQSDRHATRCLLCKRQKSADYRKKNPEKARAASAAWKTENPAKVLAYADAHRERKNTRRRERYRENPERELAVNATYYYSHKDELRPVRAAWEASNKPQRKAKRLETFLKDPEGNLEKRHKRDADWLVKHPGYSTEKWARRRARIANSPANDFTAAQFEEIKAAQKHRCYHCGKRRKLTRDHVVPVIQNGAHTVQNIVALCLECNSRKKDGDVLGPTQLNLLTEAPPKPYKPRTKKVA